MVMPAVVRSLTIKHVNRYASLLLRGKHTIIPIRRNGATGSSGSRIRFVCILLPRFPHQLALPLFPAVPPTADGDNGDVANVQHHHRSSFHLSDLAIPKDKDDEGGSCGEEADVANESMRGDSERFDERHGAGDDCDDEGSGAQQLAYS